MVISKLFETTRCVLLFFRFYISRGIYIGVKTPFSISLLKKYIYVEWSQVKFNKINR